jgi:hypothetical protein
MLAITGGVPIPDLFTVALTLTARFPVLAVQAASIARAISATEVAGGLVEGPGGFFGLEDPTGSSTSCPELVDRRGSRLGGGPVGMRAATS